MGIPLETCTNCGWCVKQNSKMICVNARTATFAVQVANDNCCQDFLPINGGGIYGEEAEKIRGIFTGSYIDDANHE